MSQTLAESPASPISRDGRTKSDFQSLLLPYRTPSAVASVAQLVLTFALFAGGWWAAYQALAISYWLTLLAAIPTSVLVVRLFCLMHDCGHGAYFRSKSISDVIGFFLGVLTWTPYFSWRRFHACHHASNGNLDRRSAGGEIRLLTVKEYQAASPWKQRLYRFYRHPAILFGVGPLWHFMVLQRFTYDIPSNWRFERRALYATNVAIVLSVALACWVFGTAEFFAVHLPITALSSSIGVWLFYIQHNYEEAYWRSTEKWSFVDAALEGSSYYRLPRFLEWLTASSGLHHIHHLDSRIPNYKLRRCMDENPEFQRAPQVSLRESLRCAHLKLWDEATNRMVGFDAATLRN